MHVSEEALSELYDYLYDEADKILKEHNPCQISKNDSGCVSCIKSTKEYPIPGLCCNGCQYLKSDGCSVKALMCKTWLCSHFPPVNLKLLRISAIASKFGLIGFHGIRASKEDIFLHLFPKNIH